MNSDSIPCKNCLTLPMCKNRFISETVMRCRTIRVYLFKMDERTFNEMGLPKKEPNTSWTICQNRLNTLREFLDSEIFL